jgi:hypothetical protein
MVTVNSVLGSLNSSDPGITAGTWQQVPEPSAFLFLGLVGVGVGGVAIVKSRWRNRN